MIGLFAACGNGSKKPVSEPKVAILVDSDVAFSQMLTANQINVAKIPTFFFENVAGTSIDVGQNTAIVTVKAGNRTYELFPPEGAVVKKVYSKPEGKTKDIVRVDLTIKIKDAKGKLKNKNVWYYVIADSKRELGAHINKAGVLTDNKTDKANKVALKMIPVKVKKEILKKDLKETDRFLHDVLEVESAPQEKK